MSENKKDGELREKEEQVWGEVSQGLKGQGARDPGEFGFQLGLDVLKWSSLRFWYPLTMFFLTLIKFVLLCLLVVVAIYYPLASLLVMSGKVPIYMTGVMGPEVGIKTNFFESLYLWFLKIQYEPLYIFAMVGIWMTPLFFFFFLISDLVLIFIWTLSMGASLLFFFQTFIPLISTALLELAQLIPFLANGLTSLGLVDYSAQLQENELFSVWFHMSLVGLFVPVVYLIRMLFEKVYSFMVPFSIKQLNGFNSAVGLTDCDNRRPLGDR